MTAHKPSRVTRGSNQYRRGTQPVPAGAPEEQMRMAAVRDAIETERVAHAFERRVVRGVAADALYARAAHPDRNERYKVAALRSCPPEVLTVLSSDPARGVRGAVARNPNTPPVVLADMVHVDEHRSVLQNVAENPSTPPQALQDLAGWDDQFVRFGVVTNPSTGDVTLTRLASDPDRFVRERVVRHPNTPTVVRHRLVDDPDDTVRHAAVDEIQVRAARSSER